MIHSLDFSTLHADQWNCYSVYFYVYSRVPNKEREQTSAVSARRRLINNKYLIRLPAAQTNSERARTSGTRSQSTNVLSAGSVLANMHECFWIKWGCWIAFEDMSIFGKSRNVGKYPLHICYPLVSCFESRKVY